MARTRARKKRVYFHRLLTLAEEGKTGVGAYATLGPAGFDTHFRTWLEQDPVERQIELDGGKLYCLPDITNEYPVVTIYKPIDSDFLSRLNQTDGTISDIFREEEDPSETIAQATVYCLDPETGIVAFARGGQSAPTAPVLCAFLDAATLLNGAGALAHRWGSEAIFDQSSMKEFQNFEGGATSAKMAFRTHRDLFTDPGNGHLARLMDEYADELGGDLEVTIGIRLARRAKQSKGARRSLKNLIEKDIDPVSRSGTKLEVSLFDDEGNQTIMNLIEAKFAAEIEIVLGDDGVRGLEQITRKTLDAMSEHRDRIEQMFK